MEILHPMFGMIALSGVIALQLLLSRAPLIIKYWGNLQAAKHSDAARPNLPERMRYITDNYNHIFEQPTLFYAVVVYIFLVNHTGETHIALAWSYVGLRVIHSIIQLTINNVTWRGCIFAVSTMLLVSMIVKEGLHFV